MEYPPPEIEEIRQACCACWGICFVISVCLMPVVWIMANRNGMNTIAWIIIVFMGSIFGFVVFLIAYLVHSQEGGGVQKLKGYTSGVYDPGDYHTTGYKARGPAPGEVPALAQESTGADPDFSDYTLDDLIDEGKLLAARKYVEDMCRMAKEMGDGQGYLNYKSYELKITQAAMRSGKEKREY